jgi:hypothetical protein
MPHITRVHGVFEGSEERPFAAAGA